MYRCAFSITVFLMGSLVPATFAQQAAKPQATPKPSVGPTRTEQVAQPRELQQVTVLRRVVKIDHGQVSITVKRVIPEQRKRLVHAPDKSQDKVSITETVFRTVYETATIPNAMFFDMRGKRVPLPEAEKRLAMNRIITVVQTHGKPLESTFRSMFKDNVLNLVVSASRAPHQLSVPVPSPPPTDKNARPVESKADKKQRKQQKKQRQGKTRDTP